MTSYENRPRRSRMKGIVPSHSDAIGLVTQPGDLAIVKRGTLRSAVMRCPDGCGEVITLNLDPRTAKAWRIYQSPKGFTLFPSVWRDTGCQSHFILWNDAIFWMDGFDVDESGAEAQKQLDDRIWALLKPDAFIDFVQLADALQEIPWAVLDACKRLMRANRAVAGPGSLKNSFRRK